MFGSKAPILSAPGPVSSTPAPYRIPIPQVHFPSRAPTPLPVSAPTPIRTTPGALASFIRTGLPAILAERVPLTQPIAAPVPVAPPLYQPGAEITAKALGFHVARGVFLPKGLSPLFVTYLAPQPIGFVPPKYYGLPEDFLFGVTAHRLAQFYGAPEYLEHQLRVERAEKADRKTWSVSVTRGNPVNSTDGELRAALTDLYSRRRSDPFALRDIEIISGELAFRRSLEESRSYTPDRFGLPTGFAATRLNIPALTAAEIERTLSSSFLRQGSVRIPRLVITSALTVAVGVAAYGPVLSLTTADDIPSPSLLVEAAHQLARGPVRFLAGERGDP